MKKTGMILAAGCMMLAMSMTAAASESKEPFNEVGIDMAVTEELDETSGLLLPYPLGAIDLEHDVYGMAFIYVAMPQDTALELMYSGDVSREEQQELTDAQGIIGMLLSGDVDYDQVQAKYEGSLGVDNPLDYEKAEETGSADGFTFYYLPSADRENYLSSIDREYADEYRKLEELLPALLKESDYYAPVDPEKAMTGQKIEFTTTDLDGNTVTSEELFSQNEITLLNCWGTWCGFCVAEMPELAEIHTRLQEKGCGFVGLEYEQEPTEETYQEARDLMEECGTNYPNVLIPDVILDQVLGFPTTIYVNKEGYVVGVPVCGPQVDQYENLADALLNGREAAPEAAGDAVPEAAAVYRVTVTDEAGPVEEVSVQFCDDSTCRFAETDENGEVTFEAPAGRVYEIHVLDVPDGYADDETVYHTEEGSNEVSIQLQKED